MAALTHPAQIQHFISERLDSCPGQEYVLVGYSQGTSARSRAWRRLSSPYAGAAATVNTLKVISASSAMFAPIRAVVLMGDPEHRPDKHANVDEDGGHTNNNATGSEHAGTGIPTWWDDSGKVMDICYKVWCNGWAVRQCAHVGCRATACARAMGSRPSITTMPTTPTRRQWPPSS
jgi:hypothetical protein